MYNPINNQIDNYSQSNTFLLAKINDSFIEFNLSYKLLASDIAGNTVETLLTNNYIADNSISQSKITNLAATFANYVLIGDLPGDLSGYVETTVLTATLLNYELISGMTIYYTKTESDALFALSSDLNATNIIVNALQILTAPLSLVSSSTIMESSLPIQYSSAITVSSNELIEYQEVASMISSTVGSYVTLVYLAANFYDKTYVDSLIALYYTKTQSDSNYYSKSYIDTLIAGYYTKTEIDTSLALYYTKTESDSNYYSKSYIDTLIALYYTKIQSDANYGSLTNVSALQTLTEFLSLVSSNTIMQSTVPLQYSSALTVSGNEIIEYQQVLSMIPSLTGYVTTSYLATNYYNQTHDDSTFATITNLNSANSNISALQAFFTSGVLNYSSLPTINDAHISSTNISNLLSYFTAGVLNYAELPVINDAHISSTNISNLLSYFTSGILNYSSLPTINDAHISSTNISNLLSYFTSGILNLSSLPSIITSINYLENSSSTYSTSNVENYVTYYELQNYALTSSLSAYVTNSSLATTLISYSTTSAANLLYGSLSEESTNTGNITTLLSYFTSAVLNLANLPMTITGLNYLQNSSSVYTTTNVQNYVTYYELENYALTSSLSTYVTNSSLSTTLTSYETISNANSTFATITNLTSANSNISTLESYFSGGVLIAYPTTLVSMLSIKNNSSTYVTSNANEYVTFYETNLQYVTPFYLSTYTYTESEINSNFQSISGMSSYSTTSVCNLAYGTLTEETTNVSNISTLEGYFSSNVLKYTALPSITDTQISSGKLNALYSTYFEGSGLLLLSHIEPNVGSNYEALVCNSSNVEEWAEISDEYLNSTILNGIAAQFSSNKLYTASLENNAGSFGVLTCNTSNIVGYVLLSTAYFSSGSTNIVTISNASNTPSSTTFLRGDNTWSVPALSLTNPITLPAGTSASTNYGFNSQCTSSTNTNNGIVFSDSGSKSAQFGLDNYTSYTYLYTTASGLQISVNSALEIEIPTSGNITCYSPLYSSSSTETSSSNSEYVTKYELINYVPLSGNLSNGTMIYDSTNVKTIAYTYNNIFSVNYNTSSYKPNGFYCYSATRTTVFDHQPNCFNIMIDNAGSSTDPVIEGYVFNSVAFKISEEGVYTSSSIDLKNSIINKSQLIETKDYLERLIELNIISYKFKIRDENDLEYSAAEIHNSRHIHIGMSYEEVEELFKYCVPNITQSDDDKCDKNCEHCIDYDQEDNKEVDYSRIICYVILGIEDFYEEYEKDKMNWDKLIIEQSLQINQLENEIKLLHQKYDYIDNEQNVGISLNDNDLSVIKLQQQEITKYQEQQLLDLSNTDIVSEINICNDSLKEQDLQIENLTSLNEELFDQLKEAQDQNKELVQAFVKLKKDNNLK